jgi:outer membrane immunogenic protein
MKIRKILFATMMALAAIGVRPLLAADLPAQSYKAPPMMAPAAVLWGGCYLGVEGGGGWGSSQHVAVSPNPAINGRPITNNFGLSGGEIGGTIGCNHQVNSFVFGVENDISWADINGSAPDMLPFNLNAVSHTNQKWLDTLRGRVGYAWEKALFYGTAGAAFAGTDATICNTFLGVCTSNAQTRTGWVAGAGIEYAMWENVSLKLEYLHADFGNGRYFTTPVALGVQNIVTRDVRLTDDIVRAGVNWRFISYP